MAHVVGPAPLHRAAHPLQPQKIHRKYCAPQPLTSFRIIGSAAPATAQGQSDEATRRQFLLSVLSFTAVQVAAERPVAADILQDATRAVVRPDEELETAVVKLLDARGTLLELRALAATSPDSNERFRARRILPGMAKRLRELGPSVPPLVALTAEGGAEAQLSYEYGGTGGETSGGAVPIYVAIGDVITISGRTIKNEAQASPERAKIAVDRINSLLDRLPEGLVAKGQDFRQHRRQ